MNASVSSSARLQVSPTELQLASIIADARTQMVLSPEKALSLASEYIQSAQVKLKGPTLQRHLTEGQAVQGQALIRLGRIAEAEATVKAALARASNTAVPLIVQGDLLLSVGQIARRKSDVQTALTSYQSAYRVFRSARAARWQAIALQTIGQLYIRGGDAATGLRYFAQSDEEYSGDPLISLSNRNNRGNAFLDLSNPAEAERQFQLALTIAESIGTSDYMSTVLGNIAQAQINQGNYGEAQTSANRALAAAKSNTRSDSIWALWEIQAQIYLKQRRYGLARQAIEKALSGVDPATGDSTFRQAHDTAYEIYRATGNDKLALAHLSARARIDYATAKLTASTGAALMAARFDFANQNLRIAGLKAAELEKSIAYERTRTRLLIVVVTASIIIALLLIVSLIIITRSRNRERAAKLVLAATNGELERAIAAKMEFLATTSHEIRTPLNGILGMTQVMLTDRTLNSALRERIGIVHSAGENMRLLVDDILDVAKMETGKLAVGTGTIELTATLRQVAQVWRLQAEAAGVSLVLDLDHCPERIEGDASRLRQIVFNLLSNAMKFTAKGEVKLMAARVDDRVRISVRDSGIGIARAWHESIFELFQQVDGGTTRQYGGTGLGLAICRNLARAMGGDVWVESEPGFGSTFTIDLPCIEIDGVRPLENRASEGGTTVLVIERNPLARGIIRAVLADRFDTIVCVGCDVEAVDILAHQGIAMVIADTASIESYDVFLAAAEGVPLVLVEGPAPAPSAARDAAIIVLAKPVSKAALLRAVAHTDLAMEVEA